MKMKEICGLCNCGKKFDLRILNPKATDEKSVWLIYGICNDENKVIVMAFFFEEPLLDRDYYIEPNKKYVVSKDEKTHL